MYVSSVLHFQKRKHFIRLKYDECNFTTNISHAVNPGITWRISAVNRWSKAIQNQSISGASWVFGRELDYITVLLFVKLLWRDGGAQCGLSIAGQTGKYLAHAGLAEAHGTANCLSEIYARAPDSSIGNVGESVGIQRRKRRARGAYYEACHWSDFHNSKFYRKLGLRSIHF